MKPAVKNIGVVGGIRINQSLRLMWRWRMKCPKCQIENPDGSIFCTDAIPLFEECENDFLLNQAREALAALG
jgi:hypothetical protein